MWVFGMRTAWFCLLFFLLNIHVLSLPFRTKLEFEKKQLAARRVEKSIQVDGRLDELIWQQAPVASNFVTMHPNIGKKARYDSEVRVAYDNGALYIAAHLYDPNPDSIDAEVSVRDNWWNNADKFWVEISPFNDGQNIFHFELTAANVQTDAKISSNNTERSWDAVWESEVLITDKGWNVEMKIPYSALRFPEKEIQVWGINFFRDVARARESSAWNPVDRRVASRGAQAGELVQIENIDPPVRLSLFPYISGMVEKSPDGNAYAYSAGMDLKYGINESYTLDMTLVPDFGQSKSDNEVLNLSPYEVRYSEKRQFFTEGLELFNKAGLFYSRRIGSKPSKFDEVDDTLAEGEIIISNPDEIRLINATKISGRNKTGTGLGFFNAMTKNMYAEILDTAGKVRNMLTEPFTNYNIAVYDKTIGKFSYFNLANTNVYEPSTGYMANVAGTAFKIIDQRNKYGIVGKSAMSVKWDSLEGKMEDGEFLDVNIGKFTGNLLFNYGFRLLTDGYDPNDLGFLRRTNELQHDASIRYRMMEPSGVFVNWSTRLTMVYESLYKPREFTHFNMRWFSNGTFKNYYSMGFWVDVAPVKRYDFFEPRVEGKYFTEPEAYWFGMWVSSDSRKKLAYSTSFGAAEGYGKSYWGGIKPRLRLSENFTFNHGINFNVAMNSLGYVNDFAEDSIIFGKRDIQRITNTLSGLYVFNNRSSLNLKIRHYWSKLDYSEFYMLGEDGYADSPVKYKSNPDKNFNIFNVDLIYSWNFAPGSFINIVWKNKIHEDSEVINDNFLNFMDNFEHTLGLPQTNNFSIKISYYIDYNKIRKIEV